MIEEVESEKSEEEYSDDSFRKLFIPELRRPKRDVRDQDDDADFSDSHFNVDIEKVFAMSKMVSDTELVKWLKQNPNWEQNLETIMSVVPPFIRDMYPAESFSELEVKGSCF